MCGVHSSIRNAVCNHPRMRRMNEAALLRQLHLHGPMSRVELADTMDLDAKTITNLIRDLLGKKIVKPIGMIPVARGRPRQILQLNSRTMQAIVIHLKEEGVIGAIMDLEGHIKNRIRAPVSVKTGQKKLLRTIRNIAGQLLNQAGTGVMGIGLAFPGIYETRQKRIVECAHLPQWKGVCLPDLLKGVYTGPFSFDTYTRAKALAEHWYGAAREMDNFILIDAGVGIGCAIVSQGRLQTGETHLAGEIGHIIIDRRGLPCRCGRRGCLETVSSLEAVRSHIQSITGQPRESLSVKVIAMMATNNPAVQSAVSEAGQTLGLALANLVQLLNPSHVVLTGEMVDLGPVFVKSVSAGLRNYGMPVFCRAVRVVPGTLGDDGALLGAGVMVFQSLFSL